MMRFIILFLVVAHQIYACTAFQLKAEDGALIYGRSMEFGFRLGSELLIVPRKTNYVGTGPSGQTGLKWTTNYGFVGMNQKIAPTVVSDGMNEKGLVASILYLPGFAKYQTPDPKKADQTIGPWELPTVLLSSCSTVAEVKTLLPTLLVGQISVPGIDQFIMPLHFFVSDTTGAAIVIEYLEGSLNIYDNPLGVLTNSPPFPYQLSNLANYINLTPDNIPELKLPNYTLKNPGQGSGLSGLPGDYTPPSRFVRATFFSAWATPPKTALEGVNLCFHILNTFDIFPGIIRTHQSERNNILLPAEVKAAMGPDMTDWIVVHDRTNLKTYFRTFESLKIQMVDLNKIDFSLPGFKNIPLARDFAIEDVTPASAGVKQTQ